jgi:hypothetical protein
LARPATGGAQNAWIVVDADDPPCSPAGERQGIRSRAASRIEYAITSTEDARCEGRRHDRRRAWPPHVVHATRTDYRSIAVGLPIKVLSLGPILGCRFALVLVGGSAIGARP